MMICMHLNMGTDCDTCKCSDLRGPSVSQTGAKGT